MGPLFHIVIERRARRKRRARLDNAGKAVILVRNNFDQTAKSILGEENAKKLDMKALGALMDSPEGKSLLKQLSGPGGDALKKAAASAADGDKGAVQRLLSSLMSSKEGQALAKQVMDIGKKK